jgi:hypothetical protein
MTHDAHDEYEQPPRDFIVKIEGALHHTIAYSLSKQGSYT